MKTYTHPTINLPCGAVVVKFYDDALSGTETTPDLIIDFSEMNEGFDINIGEYYAPIINIKMHNKNNYLLGTLLNSDELRCAIFLNSELFFYGHLTSSFSSEDDPSSGLVYTELDLSFEHHFAMLRNVSAESFELGVYNNSVGILSFEDDTTAKRYMRFKAITYEFAERLGLKLATTGDGGTNFILNREYFSEGDYPSNPVYLKDICMLDIQLIGYTACAETTTLDDVTPTDLDIVNADIFPDSGDATVVTLAGVIEDISYTGKSGDTLTGVTCSSDSFNVTTTTKIYPANGIKNRWSERLDKAYQIFGEILKEFALIPRVVHDGTDFILQIQERDVSRVITTPSYKGTRINFRDKVTRLKIDLANRPADYSSVYLTLETYTSNNYGDDVEIEMHNTNFDLSVNDWKTDLLWGKDDSGSGDHYTAIDAILNYGAGTYSETFQVAIYLLYLEIYYLKKNWREIPVHGLVATYSASSKLEYLAPGYNIIIGGITYHIHETKKSLTKNNTVITVVPVA